MLHEINTKRERVVKLTWLLIIVVLCRLSMFVKSTPDFFFYSFLVPLLSLHGFQEGGALALIFQLQFISPGCQTGMLDPQQLNTLLRLPIVQIHQSMHLENIHRHRRARPQPLALPLPFPLLLLLSLLQDL
jgi:hypothetical protein